MTVNAFLLIIGYICMGFIFGFFYGHGFGRTSGKIEGWVKAHVEIIAKIKQMKQIVGQSAISIEKKTILIIEGHDESRHLLTAILNLYGWHKIIEATNKGDGLTITKAQKINAVILGLEHFDLNLIQHAKELDIRLIAIITDPIKRKDALDLGFDDCISKPYNIDQLIELTKLLSQSPSSNISNFK